MDAEALDALVAAGKYETARRYGLAALETAAGAARPALCRATHEAAVRLGDPGLCERLRAEMVSGAGKETLDTHLCALQALQAFSGRGFYRNGPMAREGYTYTQYVSSLRAQKETHRDGVLACAGTEEEKRAAAAVLRDCGYAEDADRLSPAPHNDPDAPPLSAATGVLAGTVRFPDGSPAAGIEVCLGLAMACWQLDPVTECATNMGYRPRLGDLEVLATSTDAGGCFRFEAAPAGEHEFLAARLDGDRHEVPVAFLLHGVAVPAGGAVSHDLVLEMWQSAEPAAVASPFSATVDRGGVTYERVREHVFHNIFPYSFPRQLVGLELPPGVGAVAPELLLLSSEAPAEPVPFQIAGNRVLFFTALPGDTDRVVALYRATGLREMAAPLPDLSPQAEGAGAAVVDTGRARFRVAWGAGTDLTAPLQAVCGVDGVWRGAGRWRLPADLAFVGYETRVLEQGPLQLVLQAAYTFRDGDGCAVSLAFTFTFHRGEAYVLVHEVSRRRAGLAYEFSLAEFSGGRGYLQSGREGSGKHWSSLLPEDRVLCNLVESVSWWIPPEGFACAVTKDGLAEADYLAVFSNRRGEWVDRDFEALAQGPGDENRELDWPYPEMTGSTLSQITCATQADGDVVFRFQAFNGERRWGIYAGAFAENDGPFRELNAVQHKLSSPRLDDFKDWRLDERDRHARPSLVVHRHRLKALRAKTASPHFAPIWERMLAHSCDQQHRQAVPGPNAGVVAAVTGDPAMAWRVKKVLVGAARMWAKMVMLGREHSDIYSPVGVRPLAPWAEEYDAVVASGAFTPDEERLVRSWFILMGHLYKSPDLMNWRFNARNANFEADRCDAVGTVGLAFRGNPDADEFLAHASGRFAKMLSVYCTPGSGKWYENPACYYLHAMKCWCNFITHLAAHGLVDPASIPRFRDFLNWGIHLLMAPTPHSYAVMRDGCDGETYRALERVRRLPPVGDHARIGPWVPELYAILAKYFRPADPAFADRLLWAYQCGGSDGGYFGNLPLYFSLLDEEDVAPAPPQRLCSRRLEGFGAVFRGHFDEPNEFYLLLKLGPGGYRYHATEGSFILVADGKPLVYDGGEGAETWRHSTLSFHEQHKMLAPGHIERFCSFAHLDFAQGVHPKALAPEEPNYLSDVCHHDLVPVAFERFRELRPHDSRSVTWVKDEYVVVHDDLTHLPAGTLTHWNLQVVADEYAGSLEEGLRFAGRHGTDLQLLMPEQSFQALTLRRLHQFSDSNVLEDPEQFATLHVQAGCTGPEFFLAVLRPLPAGREMLAAVLLREGARTVGVAVTGAGVADHLFLCREGCAVETENVAFAGRYGAHLQRPGCQVLLLQDGGRLAAGGVELKSDGPAVELAISPAHLALTAQGSGAVSFTHAGQEYSVAVDGRETRCRWPIGS